MLREKKSTFNPPVEMRVDFGKLRYNINKYIYKILRSFTKVR